MRAEPPSVSPLNLSVMPLTFYAFNQRSDMRVFESIYFGRVAGLCVVVAVLVGSGCGPRVDGIYENRTTLERVKVVSVGKGFELRRYAVMDNGMGLARANQLTSSLGIPNETEAAPIHYAESDSLADCVLIVPDLPLTQDVEGGIIVRFIEEKFEVVQKSTFSRDYRRID